MIYFCCIKFKVDESLFSTYPPMVAPLQPERVADSVNSFVRLSYYYFLMFCRTAPSQKRHYFLHLYLLELFKLLYHATLST